MALFENYDLQIPTNLAFAASYKGIYITTAADVLDACQLATGDNELADAVKAALYSQQMAGKAAEKAAESSRQEVTSAYANAESYASCLHEVQEELEALIQEVETSKRLNKSQLVKTLQQISNNIHNQL